MSTIEEFIAYLRSQGVKVWNEGDRLRYRAPKGVATQNLVEQMSARKAEILAFLQEAEAVSRRVVLPHLKPSPQAERTSLSFAQQRLWLLSKMEGPSPTYNMAIALRIWGLLDVLALEKAINEIIRRHEILRTTFVIMDDQPVQIFAPCLTISLRKIDLQHLQGDAQDNEAQRLIYEEARETFDLAQAPLLSASLLILSSGPQPESQHILLINMHHIVSDGWSLDVFSQELSVLYDAFSRGQPSPLPDLLIQYADFAAWQRIWLQGDILDEHLAYWKHNLSGAPQLMELPADCPRSPVQMFLGDTVHFHISADLTQQLRSLSQRFGTTLYMTLLAAFAVLLGRYSAQDDLVIGSPIANRNFREIENLIGFFVNTLALRIDLSGNPRFRDLLTRVRDVAINAYEHQDIPFEMVVDALRPDRSLSYSPILQVMFVLRNAPPAAVKSIGRAVEYIEVENGTSKFDLTLYLTDTGQALDGLFEYNLALFKPETISRMIGHLQILLADLAADPDRRIGYLSLLGNAEEKHLLDWNATRKESLRDVLYHQLFERQAEQTPDHIALVYEDQELTYGELNRRANQLANYLQGLGIGPEKLVGICMRRSLEMIVAVLGVLKAGGAYIPLDPSYPPERLEFMLRDTCISVLLTQDRVSEKLTFRAGPTICLDKDWGAISSQPKGNPICLANSDNLAYVIYTSGSTGRPKGVMVSHRGLGNISQAQIDTFGVSEVDRVLQFSSLSFDASVFEILMALGSGASLYLGSRDALLPGEPLAHFLKTYKISVVTLPPSVLAFLPSGNFPALRVITAAGEACPADIVETWASRHRFFNLYGPTETTIWATSELCSLADVLPPIGHPIANTQVYLLDVHLQPVPVGVPGELYIGGIGLGRGYFNRPDITAEYFIPNPFSETPGERLYRTGDLGRYRADGRIEYLGRVDLQVKIRGFRIELGEIENILRQHSAIQEVVVVAHENMAGSRQLAAYFTTDRAPGPGKSELRSFLQTRLPDYMLPSAFVRLESIPHTPNGKVNRKLLPAPDKQIQRDLFIAPSTETEKILAGIWSDVLCLPEVSSNDNFFEAGGNSLLSVRVISRISQMGFSITLRQFLEDPTISGLAKAIQPGRREEIAEFATRQRSLLTSYSNLLRLQPKGSQPPIFWIHPSGGSALCYAPLAHHLGAEQPSYGIEAAGLYVDSPMDEDVPSMAEHYIQVIRQVSSDGPYRLGGWSFGGLVAFEMACQLTALGRAVDFLGLIDVYTPVCYPDSDSTVAAMHFVEWAEDLYQVPLDLSADDFAQIPAEDYVSFILERMEARGLDTMSLEVLAKSRNILPAVIQMRAGKRYSPPTYRKKITIFRARDPELGLFERIHHPDIHDAALGWGRYTIDSIDVHLIPGDHQAIMTTPGVKFLADKINDCLQMIEVNNHLCQR